MLDVVNSCLNTARFFDVQLEWDLGATEELVAQRNGPDGLCATSDDAPFTSIHDVDDIPFIGDKALEALRDHVVFLGCATPEMMAVMEDVAFSQQQAEATIRLVNNASVDVLHQEAGISRLAAENIVAARPFAEKLLKDNLSALAAVPMVGPVSLERLRDFAETFTVQPGCDHLEELVAGLLFSGLEAHDTLDLLNHGYANDLQSITGIGDVLAARILLARAAENGFETLAEVDAIPGIGASVLSALLTEVADTWCVLPHAACGCETPENPEQEQTVLELAASVLRDTEHAPAKRFALLLGTESYERFLVVALEELAVRFAGEETLPTDDNTLLPFVHEAVAAVLSQARFMRPFDVIPMTSPLPNSPTVALQLTVDILIHELSVTNLESTAVGTSFVELIAGAAEQTYLDDVLNWRNWQGEGLARTDLEHAWVFSGPFLGLQCEVTISRDTGDALDVHLGLGR
jgi:DNA uptake protein ComE-like DNA-binding protein